MEEKIRNLIQVIRQNSNVEFTTAEELAEIRMANKIANTLEQILKNNKKD
jgi:hypothetical protein